MAAPVSAKDHKRIVLIRPPFMALGFGPPIGLAYLQHTLKAQGHTVLIWDINQELHGLSGSQDYNRDFVLPKTHPVIAQAYERIDAFCADILRLKPDIAGFSLSYPTIEYGLEMAKRLAPHVRCIAGGPQASFNEQNLLDLGCFDTVVSGYGEEAVLTAINATGIITQTLDREKEYSPDYTGITIDRYKGCLPVITTRGCPNKCTFCTQNHPYLFHSIESVVKQIRDTPGIRQVMYNDSNINVNARRTTELFAELAKLKNKPYGHIFGMEIRPGFQAYIGKMADSGVREARVGIESGSPRERQSMNKPRFTNDMVIDLLKESTAHKILTWAQFIFCYPDQTQEDRQQTLDLMHEINRQCDPQFIKQFWFRFIVHHGKEEFFAEKYAVESTSPQNWRNPLYTPDKIKELAEKYTDLIPSNANIFL